MQKYGPYFRELRQSKDVTLAQLAADTGLTEGFISRFERGQSDITVSRFTALLEALNVAIEEFLLGMRHSTTDSEEEEDYSLVRVRKMMPSMAPYFAISEVVKDASQVKSYIDAAEAAYRAKPTRKNHFIWLFYQSMNAILQKPIDNASLARIQAPIMHYLQQVDNWGVYECYLFIAFTPALAPVMTVQLLRIGLKRSRFLKHSPSFEQIDLQLAVAALTSLMARDEMTAAVQVMKMMNGLDRSSANRVIATGFFNGWLQIKLGKRDAGIATCEHAIQQCSDLGLTEWANRFNEILNSLKTTPPTDTIFLYAQF
ncbi:helix-turn-helix domain-containing protein [Lacticaseibacillus jixianensis]|uniref:Helix-turn-helix domain-containing protein n=1 Tax=Lacticaseibacillus jixianensis TaxID=2486012 RepID=A0ABW4BA29_9LACO|nr:Rgg/GadR/MutR family transcriptional regulator [Lacticaseibacillus jixianensis]